MAIQKRVFRWILLLTMMVPVSGGAQTDKDGTRSDPHASGYLQVTGPCQFEFPRDHGAHPGYRVEWWYYTGQLYSDSGKRCGFQLTFFRVQIGPPGSEAEWPERPSAWRTQQVFLAHAAVSDLDRGRFYFDEKMARGALGLAGAVQEEDRTKIFLGAWSAVLTLEKHFLKACSDRFCLDLACLPLKPPVAHGDNGYSLKGSRMENASCYYSFTRLKASGRLNLGNETFTVDGSAWMDHEYSTAPLEETIAGWDWFSFQFSDQTELMIYLLRLDRGGYHPASGGTWVGPSGEVHRLRMDDLKIEILDTWTSGRTGAAYPCRWRLRVTPLGLDVHAFSNLADQELITRASAQVIYWEGSISAEGFRDGKTLEGKGYAEMTGYAAAFDLLK